MYLCILNADRKGVPCTEKGLTYWLSLLNLIYSCTVLQDHPLMSLGKDGIGPCLFDT